MPYVAKRVVAVDPNPYRYSVFWPVLILIAGLGLQALSQMRTLDRQRDSVVRGMELLDPKVQVALYEKNEYYYIVSQLLRLSPKNPNAQQVVDEFQLRRLQEAQPELTSMTTRPVIPGSVAALTASAASLTDPSSFLEKDETNAPPTSSIAPPAK